MLRGVPSFVAFFNALRRPCITVSLFAPDFSSCAMNMVDLSMSRPSCCRAVPFWIRPFCNVSTLTPVFCAARVIASRSAGALFADFPKADRAFCVKSIEVLTSVLLIFANLTNCPARFSSVSPVTPNRVFTSPIAVPAVSKSVGSDFARLRALVCIASSCLPVAPVFFATMFRPSCTSLKDLTAAAPTAMIGAVTYFVIPRPTLCIFAPTS